MALAAELERIRRVFIVVIHHNDAVTSRQTFLNMRDAEDFLDLNENSDFQSAKVLIQPLESELWEASA